VRPPLPTLSGVGGSAAHTTLLATPPAAINTPAAALALDTRSEPPPPEEGWADETTATMIDARSIAAELRTAIRAEMLAAIDAAVSPLLQKIQDLSAQLELARKDRADLAGKIAALAAAPPSAQIVSAQLVSAPLPSARAARVEQPVVVSERIAQPTSPSGYAPALKFDTAPYPDMPGMLDGSRRTRRVAWFVAFVLVALVGGIGVMTILSYSR
jgi:hypothetical protein